MTKTYEFENWMRDLPLSVKNQSIINLCLPGSHNSFTYTIGPRSEISPDAPSFLLRLSPLFQRLIKPFVYKWSVTQVADVIEQLQHGIRYFDIRLVKKGRHFYIAHSMYGSNLNPVLIDLQLFLKSHREEIIILDFQHFYDFSTEDHFTLIGNIEDLFKEKICPRVTAIINLSLHSLIQNGYQVLIIYRNPIIWNKLNFWPSCSIPNPWPNEIDIQKLINSLDNGLRNRDLDKGFVSQGILTITGSYAVLHLRQNLKKLAIQAYDRLLPWAEQKQGLNIIIADFVEHKKFLFSKLIIDKNFNKGER